MNKLNILAAILFSIGVSISGYQIGYQIGYQKAKEDVNKELAAIWAKCIFEGNSTTECGIGFVKRWLNRGNTQ